MDVLGYHIVFRGSSLFLIALRTAGSVFVLLFASLAPGEESAGPGAFEIGPWRLGMTRDQVQSFADYGPYAPVEVTGGLETRRGPFQGKDTNVSFVFDEQGLRFIQVWKYEGKDDAAAQAAVVDVYRLFASSFGGAEIDNVEVSGPDGLTEEALRVLLGRVLGTARELAADIQRKHKGSMVIMFDMMPKTQPAGSQLHSQWGYNSRFDTFYVFLYQDRAEAKRRRAVSNIELLE